MAESEKTIQEQNREKVTRLGIGLGIASTIAGRKPIVRAGKKIYQGIKSLWKAGDEITDLPATKNTELNNVKIISDEVEAMSTLQRKQQAVRTEMEANNTIIENIQQKVKEHPLTFAGRNLASDTDISVNGSVLFDKIATFPSMGRKKGYQASGEAWANYFKKKELKITRDELADTNIAYFDDKNNLIGGYLKLAQDEKVPVSAKTLLEMVARSPAHKTGVIRFGTGQDVKPAAESFFDEFDDVMARVKKQVDDIVNKENIAFQKNKDFRLDEDVLKLKDRIDESIRYYYQSGTDFKSRNFGASVGPQKSGDADFIEGFKNKLELLSARKDKFDDLGIPFDETFTPLLNKFEEFRTVLNRDLGLGVIHPAKYATDSNYRLFGPEEYYEDLIYFKNLSGGAKGEKLYRGITTPTSQHYKELADNQLYHIRYGKRALEGNSKEKVFVVDEVQSDVQQRVGKQLRQRNAIRLNPTNLNYLQKLFKDRRIDKYYEMQELLEKQLAVAGRLNVDTSKKYAKLSKEFDEITKAQKDPKLGAVNADDLVKRYNEGINREGGNVDFLPLLDTEKGWGGHSMKYLVKQAIRNDVDYIGINPVEQLMFQKGAGRKMGSLLFYGNSRGTAGFRNYTLQGQKTDPNKTATLPQVLKDLAKQYNSTAKTIRVAKSDPKKPFKVFKERGRFDAGDEIFNSSDIEHLGAFKTKIEAERVAEQTGGKVKEMLADDPDLYYSIFGLKITPEMKTKPFKLYKKTGGLVVNIFKW